MAQGISVVLDENYSKELRKQVYSIISDEIERARRDTALDKQYLRRKDAIKYCGVAPGTFDSWKIPVHQIDSIKLYAKKDLSEFIEMH